MRSGGSSWTVCGRWLPPSRRMRRRRIHLRCAWGFVTERTDSPDPSVGAKLRAGASKLLLEGGSFGSCQPVHLRGGCQGSGNNKRVTSTTPLYSTGPKPRRESMSCSFLSTQALAHAAEGWQCIAGEVRGSSAAVRGGVRAAVRHHGGPPPVNLKDPFETPVEL